MRRKQAEPARRIGIDERSILIFGRDFFSAGRSRWTQAMGGPIFPDEAEEIPEALRKEMKNVWAAMRETILFERQNKKTPWAARVFDGVYK